MRRSRSWSDWQRSKQAFLMEGIGVIAMLATWLAKVPVAGKLFTIWAVADVVTGIMRATRTKRWHSSHLETGLWRKFTEALLITAFFMSESYWNAPIGSVAAGAFAVKEVLSCYENARYLGVDPAPWLGRFLGIQQEMIDKDIESMRGKGKEPPE